VPSGDPTNQSKTVGKYLRFLNLGFEFFVAIGVFVFAGVWLDRRAGTTALFTILGSILGFVSGFYMIYRALYSSSVGKRGKGDQAGRDADSKSGRGGNFGDGA
jgi:F0F1-type ATP synthase assembly protein I